LKTIKENQKEITLSHSSANLLRGCEQKYAFYKVRGVDKDPDFDDNQEHFNVGKAVHYILETSLYVWDRDSFFDLVHKAAETFDCQHKEELLAVMAFKGMQIQKGEGLHAVHCEYKIETKYVLGYVDLVACDEDKNWWIIDLKTAKKLSDLTVAKLSNDYQLNLYAAHYKIIAKALGLDPKKYMGCRYRVITKSSAKQKSSEDIQGYMQRVLKSGWVKGHEIIVPKEQMNPDMILKEHRALWRRAKKLHEGSKPKCDYAFCSSFFRPCEYYSHCHGDTYTNSLTETLINEY